MRVHRIRRGLDIPMTGRADPGAGLAEAPEPARVGVVGAPVRGLRLRAAVREGDRVEVGAPVMIDRDESDIRLVAPASGRVVSIEHGAHHAPRLVVIERDGDDDAPRPAATPPAAGNREDVARALQRSGLWPLLRERPLGRVPGAYRPPDALFVNGMDTEPLAAEPAFLVGERGEDLQAGVDLLAGLCPGSVYLSVPAADPLPPAYTELRGVEVHRFAGPHPSGLPGTHIDRIAPLRPGQVIWTVRAQHVARIGRWARTGRLPTHRVVAAVGPALASPGYRRVREGAPLSCLVGDVEDGARIVRGTVLSGAAASADDFLAPWDDTITAVFEGRGRRPILGWARPRFALPRGGRNADARLHGEVRPLINVGQWDRVMPLDVNVAYLIRAIEAGDVDEAVDLGLLDVVEEDVALCTFVDPSKTDVGAVIRRGLDAYEREEGA